MMAILESAWQSVLSFLTTLYTTALPYLQQVDRIVWLIAGGALLLVLLLWALLRSRRSGRPTQPEVLVSLGAISASEVSMPVVKCCCRGNLPCA
jgi:hypothetical protein